MTNFSSTPQFSSTMSLSEYLLKGYWDAEGDPRVPHLLLMSSFGPMAAILSVYSVLVHIVGPRFMANRKAFSLKPLLIVYNLLLSLWNVYFLLQFLALHNYGWDIFNVEKPSFKDESPETKAQIELQHLYLLSKLVDLFETLFFVLRKKQSQVTFLHFYHHLTVPIFGWINIRLVGNGRSIIIFGLLNSNIHAIMYAYYGLAAIGPQMQPYLWWKRYITQIQIIQFLILFVYGIGFTLFQTGYQFFFIFCHISQSAFYIYLFTRFYLQTYKRNYKDMQTVQTTGEDANNNVKFTIGKSKLN